MACHWCDMADDMVAVSVTRPYREAVNENSTEMQIRAIYVYPDKNATWIRTGPDTAVPSIFEAQLHVSEPELTINMKIMVGPGGRILIREFGLSPKDLGSTITARLLRKVPVDRLSRAALDHVSLKVVPRPDIHSGAFQLESDPPDQAWVSPEPIRGRGREVSPDRVGRAAQIYLEALAAGSRKPAEVVAEQLHYSRATAARDIRAARERGLLPEAGAPTQASALTPPSNEVVAADPIWRRFDDPTKWASMHDVLDGPSGLPVFDPNRTGTSAPSPTPVPRDPSEPDTWIQRIRDAAAFNRENPKSNETHPGIEGSPDEDADAADE